MINCVLPGRIGELARPVLLKKNEDIPFSTGLATVGAERAFDISFLLLLFLIVVSFVQIDPDIRIAFGKYQLTKSVRSFSRSMRRRQLPIMGTMKGSNRME